MVEQPTINHAAIAQMTSSPFSKFVLMDIRTGFAV
jgi:hypothetical protein